MLMRMSSPIPAARCRTCVDPQYLGERTSGEFFFSCPDCGKRFARRKRSSEWLISMLLRDVPRDSDKSEPGDE